ncbi:MAG TPA: hypothetical protein VLJ10_02320, partial [Candidatus Bathyarchaeia archaeon]|nr:hypothetical protein [Candidatus Bathyarchaeia archaeon]
MRYTKSSLFKAMMMAAVVLFIVSNLTATAQITLPEPTQLLETGTVVTPPMVIGMRIDPKDPFSFKFLVDMGEARLDEAAERQEYEKLVKYFLTALTIPNNDMWVNLSPYEADKIIPGNFALTEMGFELLAQDYTLKQLSASMLNPDSEVG